MLKILMVCPRRDDATSFYRGWGWFGEQVRKSEQDIILTQSNAIDWSVLADTDIVFLQRPFHQRDLILIDMANMAGVPVWVDWDDLLWGLTPDNPYFQMYQNCGVNILGLAAGSSIITVSTEALKQALPVEVRDKAIVRHNSLPERWRRRAVDPIPPKGAVKIVWRGTETHAGDWMDYIDGAVEFSKTHAVEWILVGKAPLFVVEKLSAVTTVKQVGTIPMEKYFQFMIEQGPVGHIMFVPLRDTPFNRAKSCIAKQEATFGGMITVTPCWSEWESPGCYQYDPCDHGSAVEMIDMAVFDLMSKKIDNNSVVLWEQDYYIELASDQPAIDQIIQVIHKTQGTKKADQWPKKVFDDSRQDEQKPLVFNMIPNSKGKQNQ